MGRKHGPVQDVQAAVVVDDVYGGFPGRHEDPLSLSVLPVMGGKLDAPFVNLRCES